MAEQPEGPTKPRIWITSNGQTVEWRWGLSFTSQADTDDSYRLNFRHFVVGVGELYGEDLPDAFSARIEHDDRVMIVPDVRKVWVPDDDGPAITDAGWGHWEWRTFPGAAKFEWGVVMHDTHVGIVNRPEDPDG